MSMIFGPVPSRRLGQSLGIDPVVHKTCNWNCIYCQLGRSTPMTNERKEYVPRQQVIDEVKTALAKHPPGEIDWITFVGSGEPTLHSSLGWMIRQVKALTDIPVAVITNGALLYLPEVRRELSAADAVMPTLDAGTADLYKAINRPIGGLTFESHVSGLTAFRQEYAGKLWVEVMLIAGMNDSVEALEDIAHVLRQVQPDAVHILLPTRPPAESTVHAAGPESLARAAEIFGDIAEVVRPPDGEFSIDEGADVSQAVIDIITRHPMSETQLTESLSRWTPGQVEEALTALLATGQARRVIHEGKPYWSLTKAHYERE